MLLSVRNLEKFFPSKGRHGSSVRAVNGVSFDIKAGETFGLVGESGCGKSTAAKTIIRLLDPSGGSVIFDGLDFSSLSKRKLKPYRKNIQMVFQDPYASLHPRMTIEQIIMDPLVIHGVGVNNTTRRKMVEELLDRVGLDPVSGNRYPHEFSGGQRQRVGIARALALNPRLIILDEPVSALDVSVQAQILNLLKKLQREFDLTYLFISHDLSVIDFICDTVGVMYLGRIVEFSTKKNLFDKPLHPYTKALISAIPEPDPSLKKRRTLLTGDIPSATNIPAGCAFHTRCPEVFKPCYHNVPKAIPVDQGHRVSCHLYR